MLPTRMRACFSKQRFASQGARSHGNGWSWGMRRCAFETQMPLGDALSSPGSRMTSGKLWASLTTVQLSTSRQAVPLVIAEQPYQPLYHRADSLQCIEGSQAWQGGKASPLAGPEAQGRSSQLLRKPCSQLPNRCHGCWSGKHTARSYEWSSGLQLLI